MANLIELPHSSPCSENGEIDRLFPKCRPRVYSPEDINQNKVDKRHAQVDNGHAFPVTSNNINNNNNNKNNNNNNNNNNNFDIRNSSGSEDMGDSASSKSYFVGGGGGGHVDAATKASHCFNSNLPVENSFVSAYTLGDFIQLSSEKAESLDGYSPQSEHSFRNDFFGRESRIEIAGGRELFSKSKSRAHKKRHNEEVVYHPSNPENFSDLKRLSGMNHQEKHCMYNLYKNSLESKSFLGDLVGANNLNKLNSHRAILGIEEKSSSVESNYNGSPSSSKTSQENYRDSPELMDDCQGSLVYETVVENAATLYDDIGDMVPKPAEFRHNGLQIKTQELKVLDFPSTNGDNMFSPRSDGTPEGKRAFCDVGNSPIDAYSPSWKLLEQESHDERSTLSSPESNSLKLENATTKPSIPRIIGNLPIAEYEGSPKRYGPRPGYPQRVLPNENSSNCESKPSCGDTFPGPPVLPNDNKSSLQNSSCSNINQVPSDHCDIAYTPLDRRPLSEDSFGDKEPVSPSFIESEFSELEYRLYRVNAGSTYVGRRLAFSSGNEESDDSKCLEKELANILPIEDDSAEVSPRFRNHQHASGSSSSTVYIPNEQELMLLHERVHQHTLHVELTEHDGDSVAGTEDLGETEIGEQVDHTRNFTLSPETTDCDSNDIESVVSIEGSLHSGGHLVSSMPVLEDGLSSGHSSDSDDSSDEESAFRYSHHETDKTMLQVKQQLCEIEQQLSAKNITSAKELERSCRKFADLQEELSNDLDYPEELEGESKGLCSEPHQETVDQAIKEIKQAIQLSKSIQLKSSPPHSNNAQPIWVPRLNQAGKEIQEESQQTSQADEVAYVPEECDTDQETDRLLGAQRVDDKEETRAKNGNCPKKKNTSKEAILHEPTVLIEGVLFRARYLGSTLLVCEGQPTKATRMMQAEEAVTRIKSLAPEGESQPSTEIDLFISTEKIMVLNTDLKEIMMDHALRTISYIADIGDLVVLMARRRILNSSDEIEKIKQAPKMICHVFESEEAQFIAQSIGQAFQVAYMEFLKANGIEDSSFVKEMDYQEVLNSQEIFGNELEMFAKKEKQKEVVVPKQKGEILGMVIVESGWGSMLPTVVIANMAHTAPASRCGQLNIGDQIIAINGVSLVGLPLSTCQNYIKNTKNQTVVKFTVVPCAPVVEVKIKRPDTKYQLGFSVQNGVICSLLRGGIAERGGVRVGHRIIEINNQSVVAVPHEKIVNLLATSVGEINMKTMPTSMFRLLTGQESPLFI